MSSTQESPHELKALLEKFPSQRLLVLGDVILDRYWWGECNRLSPEAPVPIVHKQRTTLRPGGAANTAANLVSLGASAAVAGVVGADTHAAELRGVLEQSGILAYLVEDPSRPTTNKTRIMALHQQVVRVDEEASNPLPDVLAEAAYQWVSRELPGCQGMVLSDYAKGFLTPGLLANVIAKANASGCRTFVDPKGADYKRYLGCFLLKPNRLELGLLTGMPVRNRQETIEAGRALSSRMPGTAVLVTEGAEGMTLIHAGGAVQHTATARKQVFDVTGAGDTVLAVIAVAACCGAPLDRAMELATHAASLTISVMGTSAITRQELAEALES